MYTRWCVLISGFRQTTGTETGMDIIFRDLIATKGVRAEYMMWKSDWEDYAAYLHRHVPTSGKIILAGYSWGAGWGVKKLSEALQGCGRVVHHAVLADPVYRAPWAPAWFTTLPSSLTTDRVIKYPPNVREISWFFQREDKPAGHKPIGAKTINAGVQLEYTHAGMEDCQEFRQAVLDIATE